MTKTIMILAIAAAFVAGIVAAPNLAMAHLDACSQPGANSNTSVWHALCDLQEQINAINVDDADSDPMNELQTISGSGDVTLSDGGGTVSCADITGDASLCDGNDAVDDADNSATNEIELAINGGSTTCVDITGDASLCDGNDADTVYTDADAKAAIRIPYIFSHHRGDGLLEQGESHTFCKFNEFPSASSCTSTPIFGISGEIVFMHAYSTTAARDSSHTYTVLKNGSPTFLSCTVTNELGGPRTCSDTSPSIPITSTDRITIRVDVGFNESCETTGNGCAGASPTILLLVKPT